VRTAVLADVHANLAALTAVLEDIRQEKIYDIVSLGDNIGYGPDPEEVTLELLGINAVSILGNHEYALVDEKSYSKMNPDPKKSLDMTRVMLSDEGLAFATGLPRVIIHHGARLVHGCPPQSLNTYLYFPSRKMLTNIFTSFPERICFYGHTHTLNFFEEGKDPVLGINISPGTYILKKERRYIINPGSVGQPRDGINNHAKYLIWDRENELVVFKNLEYDVMKTVNKLRLLDFPDFNATRLLW